MAKVAVRPETGKLFIDFRWRGKRHREQTLLEDTKENRAKLEKLREKIEAEITLGTLDPARYFPKLGNDQALPTPPATAAAPSIVQAAAAASASIPLFQDFAKVWYTEMEVTWRMSHRATRLATVERVLVPRFGGKRLDQITKADVLLFRAELAKKPGRCGNATLSAQTINHTMTVLRLILNEAVDRFNIPSAFRKVKPLKIPRPDIHPFTTEEMNKLLEKVRPDYRDYLLIRFLTGLRSGEADGLKWKHVDVQRGVLHIRETWVDGRVEYTKTDGSQRDVVVCELVREALKRQEKITRGRSDFVFCNRNGDPLDNHNFTNRIWYPLLKRVGLERRRPYEMRHTTATLWLAAGENPEWIARQMGHMTTQMLFTVYSRFVPNLTRRDGSAFETLITSKLVTPAAKPESP
jgi:integrase